MMAGAWTLTGRWRIRPTRFRRILRIEVEEERLVRYGNILSGDDEDIDPEYELRWRTAREKELDIDMEGRVGRP